MKSSPLHLLACYLPGALAFLLACSHPNPSASAAENSALMQESTLGYTFERPDATFELPKDLNEISGLTTLSDDLLGAVQDEDGKLFLIDPTTGRVEDDYKFGKDGDYEGLARVEEALFVLRSDGELTRLRDWADKDTKTDAFKTPLKAKHDTEGLAYDAANRRLLIVCKEYPGKDLEGYRAIYAFDLAEEVLLETPVFTIELAALRHYIEEAALNARLRDLLSPVADLSDIKPSALAIHPQTGDIYLLSSVRKLVIVLTAAGALKKVVPLNEKDFRQPEALTFLSNGDLFIANEGRGKRATLLRFNYQPTP